MMRSCTISLLRLCATVCVIATATSHRALAQTLDSLIRIAQTTHPSVAAARVAIDRADARARAAEAWEAPRVGLEIMDLPPNEPNPFARGETMFMVEQMIPLFGQNRAMARAERLGAAVAESQIAAVQRELAARIERDYLTLWLLERRRALNADSRRIAEVLFKAVEAQSTLGIASQADLFRATIELEKLGMENQFIDDEHRDVRARLNTLLGRADSTTIAISDTLGRALAGDIDELEELLAEHPSLRAMEAMAAMSNAEAEAQLAMLDPMLMLRGGVSYAPEGHAIREGSDMAARIAAGVEHGSRVVMDDPMRWGITVGAMVSIPLASWSRSGPEALAEERRMQAQEQLLRRDAMLREMSGALRGAMAQARRAQLRRDYHVRTQIPLLERTLQSLQAEYINGRAPFASVIDAYAMLVMARMDAYMQEMEYAMAIAMIKEMTGVHQ